MRFRGHPSENLLRAELETVRPGACRLRANDWVEPVVRGLVLEMALAAWATERFRGPER
jgi:hypothetical protein